MFSWSELVLSFFSEGVVGVIRKDDMIEERDIEDIASFLELVRLVHVRGTRGGIPARVVVELYRWFSYSE